MPNSNSRHALLLAPRHSCRAMPHMLLKIMMLAVALSREAAAALSRGCQPTGRGLIENLEPRSGDITSANDVAAARLQGLFVIRFPWVDTHG